MNFPETFKDDISAAIDILKNEGCSEVYLFGSVTSGKMQDDSDIDIAIKGLPKARFFSVYGRLISTLDHNVDLVMLDLDSSFSRHLIEKGNLQRVA